MSILQRLYDSEINFEVSGFDVRLGDHLSGFLAEGKVETWAEVEAWLRDQALTHFPLVLPPFDRTPGYVA
jgi:hypothetical protein